MADDSPQPPLTLPPDQMRRLGYQMVDLVVDALAGLRDRPPSRRAGPEELAGLLNEPVPRTGAEPGQVLRQAVADVLGPAMRVDHPRFFAYVPIPSNYVGMLADALVSGFGVFAGDLAGRLGRGRGRGGHPALAAGAVRPARDGRRAVRRRRLLGQPVRPGRGLAGGGGPAGGGGAVRLRPDPLLDRPGRRAARPFCVVATSGTTSTGSVDPLAGLAALCRLWFHVDGAFGAPAILTAGGRELLAGIEQADSLALDAHKWLFQPLEAGCVLVRDVALLESIFSSSREFLLGLDAFAAAVQHGMDLAGYADALLRRRSGWEVVAPTRLALVTFCYADGSRTPEELETVNRRVEQLAATV